MVTPELNENYLHGAHEFTAALSQLGFDMDAVFWGYDVEDERHILVVITDVFDTQGPLEISKQLFRAYNASLTPKEIDPFIVRLLSANQIVAKELLHIITNNWRMRRFSKDSPFAVMGGSRNIEGEVIAIEETTSGDIVVRPEWVVISRGIHKTRKTVEINRRWHSFKRHIDEKIAA